MQCGRGLTFHVTFHPLLMSSKLCQLFWQRRLSLLEVVGKHGLAKACERWSSRRTFSVVVLAPQQKIFYSEEGDGWFVVWRYISFLLLDCSAWVLVMKIYTTFCSILYRSTYRYGKNLQEEWKHPNSK